MPSSIAFVLTREFLLKERELLPVLGFPTTCSRNILNDAAPSLRPISTSSPDLSSLVGSFVASSNGSAMHSGGRGRFRKT